MKTVLRHLRKAALLQARESLTDGQLLDSFVARRDEAAFEALVRRHGPMVLGAVRRLVRHAQDAEDCFQAAFLVPAQRAGSVRKRGSLAGRLYGVACRVALRCRCAAPRPRGAVSRRAPYGLFIHGASFIIALSRRRLPSGGFPYGPAAPE